MFELARKHPPTRVLLDCTHAYTTGLNTGIQRVVRNLCRMATKLGPDYHLQCVPVIREGGAFFPVSFEPKREKRAKLVPRMTNAIIDGVSRAYCRVMNRVCKLVPHPKLRRWFLPERGHWGVLKVPYLAVKAVRYRISPYFTRMIQEDDGAIHFKSGDMLVLLEPNLFREGWQTLDNLSAQGVTIGTIIYDLIPITHPQYVHGGNVIAFNEWFDGIANRADFFAAISETVRHDLQQYMLDKGYINESEDERFHSFRLGCDLDQLSKSGAVREEVRSLFAKKDKAPIYLLVATVEPRKNHMYLLDAFDKAWQAGSRAKLCFIGRYGWLCDDIVARIEKHPAFGKQLFWFRDLNDNELQHCYQHGDGLMYPSFAEGFGLPLIEALSNRLPVLASDIPIHREVGQDFCNYFDLDDPQQLTDMILSLDRNSRAIQARDPREYDIADWKQSCREFLSACSKHAGSSRGKQSEAEAEAVSKPEPALLRRAA